MMSANHYPFKLSILAAAMLGLSTLPSVTLAQHEHDNPSGYPLDWSNSHVKFRPAGNLQDQKKFESDPRYLRHQYEERGKWEKLADDDVSGHRDHRGKNGAADQLKVDWAVSLGTGDLTQNMSAAKFSTTGSATPACSDMVIYALNITGDTSGSGSSQQANLIGVNNIYSTCTGSPSVAFAYADTLGTIATSPVVSYFDNGAQVAFVANEGGKATLRVVKYSTAASNGTAAGAPVALPGTGSQTTALAFSATTDTNSSLFVDYFGDAAYVGDDGGKLYKISPVFGGGTPAIVWTATLAGTMTGPIEDLANGVVLVGSSNGTLYARKALDGTVLAGTNTLAVGNGSAEGGIVDPPVIVEEGYGLPTYVFVTTGCDAAATGTALVEASDTIAGLTSLASRAIGNGRTAGTAACATNKLHAPALDDNSYNGLAGYVYACGTFVATTGTSTTEIPVLYSFTFPATGGTIGATSTNTYTPATTNAADECSPITYFTSDGVEKIFFGHGHAAGATSAIESNTVDTPSAGFIGTVATVTAPTALAATSGIVVDNASATASQANIYFTALAAGNLTGGSCDSFTPSGGTSTGNTVTLNGTGFNFAVGDTIVVSGFISNGGLGYGTAANFNGTWVVAGTTGTTSLTYTVTGIGTNSTSTGFGAARAAWGTCAFQLTQSGLS